MENKQLKRNCSICNKELFYTTKGNCDIAIKNKTVCRSCAQKTRTGDKNSFFGLRTN